MDTPPAPEMIAASRANQVHQAAALLRELGLSLESQLPSGTRVALCLQVYGGDEHLDVAVMHQYPTAGISTRGYSRYTLANLNMNEVSAWCVSWLMKEVLPE
jgi:hypothetical protein